MITKDFKGYREGEDLTKIPARNLAFPSKNCIVHKGKVFSRLGIKVHGSLGSTNLKVHSEKVWKDSKSGEMPLRMTGAILQVDLEKYKTGAGWTNLLTVSSVPDRMEFASWTDINTAIIKKRMFMVHGTGDMIQWNGGVGVIASESGSAITINGSKTLLELGFDDGTTTTQTVIINGVEYTYTHDPTTKILTLDSAPSTAPVAGDLIIVKPITHTTFTVPFGSLDLATINKDHIYTYNRHVVIGNLESNDFFGSGTGDYSMTTGLDYVVPVAGSRTATSPMYFTLDANITAMIERKGVLWVSTIDDWFKITKLYSQNGFDEWFTVEKVKNAERMGALPFAVSSHKGDTIFVGQDSTVQSISDLELIQSDQIKLISDDIEDMLLRYDLTDCRIYYNGRYIYITVPIESVLIMFDVVENNWQPPQILPIQCMSLIGGIKVGHSNNTDESFTLFTGKDDLGADIETIIAFGYQGYTSDTNELEYKWFSTFGVSGRITEATTCTVALFYETDGAKSSTEIAIDGSKIKTYDIPEDVSWGTYPFASRSWAGGDVAPTDLKRFLVFDKPEETSFFEWRPVFTITGDDQEFHLLAFSADVGISENNRENDLFIEK